jgi:copper chaperone CopZ
VRKVPGVTAVAVDLATKEVQVTGEPACGAVLAAIDEAGYDVAS